MKVFLTIALSVAAGLSFVQHLHGQSKTSTYQNIIDSGSKQEKDKLKHELLLTSKSSKKYEELKTSINYLYRLGEQSRADSISQVVARKFPKSDLARNEFIYEVLNKSETAATMEKNYKTLLKKWPLKSFPQDAILYDYATSALVNKLLDEQKNEQALQYLGDMRLRFWRAQAYAPVARKLLTAGDTTRAQQFIQTSIEDAEYYINLPADQQNNEAKFAAVGYPGYIAQMVDIYEHQGKSAESIELIEKALKIAPDQAARFSQVYYKGLQKTGRKLEALQQLEILYKEGNFNLKENLQQLYIELNGSDKGLSNYLSNMDQAVVEAIRKHIASQSTYKDAPAFSLQNLAGETVSLADLKGKIVVIDFWATWCQPCIRSFPGMQAAQEHYKNDETVQFLFLNTWEKNKDYKTNVAAFIKNNKYPFEVLFDDQKDPNTGENLAAKFGVQGIPAKFIIDQDGKIRYALTGSNGNLEYTKLEMIELIEASKKPHKI